MPQVILIHGQKREGMFFTCIFFFLNLYDKPVMLDLSNLGLRYMSDWRGETHL